MRACKVLTQIKNATQLLLLNKRKKYSERENTVEFTYDRSSTLSVSLNLEKHITTNHFGGQMGLGKLL